MAEDKVGAFGRGLGLWFKDPIPAKGP